MDERTKQEFRRELGSLSRKYKIGIHGKFAVVPLEESECEVFDHGYYEEVRQGVLKWTR